MENRSNINIKGELPRYFWSERDGERPAFMMIYALHMCGSFTILASECKPRWPWYIILLNQSHDLARFKGKIPRLANNPDLTSVSSDSDRVLSRSKTFSFNGAENVDERGWFNDENHVIGDMNTGSTTVSSGLIGTLKQTNDCDEILRKCKR